MYLTKIGDFSTIKDLFATILMPIHNDPCYFCFAKALQPKIYLPPPFVSHTGLKDVSSVNGDTSLGELGLDSLMGVEVKQTLERHHDVIMEISDIRKLTFNRIKQVSTIL